VPTFQDKGGESREIPVRQDLEGFVLADVDAAGIAGDARKSPAVPGRQRPDAEAVGQSDDVQADLRAGEAAAQNTWPGTWSHGRPASTTGGRGR